jgi:hypothetical protein
MPLTDTITRQINYQSGFCQTSIEVITGLSRSFSAGMPAMLF